MRRWLAVALLTLVAVPGCSEDDDETGSNAPGSHSPCQTDPWGCPEGETCWVDYGGASLICQAEGPGVAGSPCINSLGLPTCGADLGCYQVAGQSQGVCSPLCDPVVPDLQCEDGARCRPILYRLSSGDAVIHLCQPPGQGGSGGTGGAGTSAGGDSGAGGQGD